MFPYGMEWYQNDSLVEEVGLSFSSEEEINLPKGTYTAEYISIFLDTVREKVKIVSDTRTICFDALVLSKEKLPVKYWTERLAQNDTVEILCTIRGCRIPSYTEKLLLYKKGKKLYASYNDLEKEMNKESINWLNTFEAQLRNMPRYYCTTTYRYNVTFNDEQLNILDGSCRWDGFNNLLIKLGFEE